jgi:uncharacterized membrane protein
VKKSFRRWRVNFLAGLAVLLPAVVSIALVTWLFDIVSGITDTLLFFLPRSWTHQRGGEGPVYWYWSLFALLLTILLIGATGGLARYYIGKKLIQGLDQLLSRVPLLNKIYGAVKQVNEAFASSKKSAFRQVVLVEYPRAGIYSIGFITSDDHPEAAAKTGQKVLGVFVATTPNPTSGFLLVVPEDQVTRLDMSVAEGIKYIMSLGSIVPAYAGASAAEVAAQVGKGQAP